MHVRKTYSAYVEVLKPVCTLHNTSVRKGFHSFHLWLGHDFEGTLAGQACYPSDNKLVPVPHILNLVTCVAVPSSRDELGFINMINGRR